MLEKIAEIICEYVYIDPAEITEQANLRTDIGLSSLDLMSVASDMENTFGVKIPERAILTAKTVKDTATTDETAETAADTKEAQA